MTPKALSRGTWRGKEVTKMSKEELIEALEQIGGLYQSLLKERLN